MRIEWQERSTTTEVLCSLALGLGLTLPWVMLRPYPEAPLLPLWILDRSQAVACAVAYGVLTVALALSLGALIYHGKRKRAARARTSPNVATSTLDAPPAADSGRGDPSEPASPLPVDARGGARSPAANSRKRIHMCSASGE